MPEIPSCFHAALALLGPRSAPPCFLDPPTRVGAIPPPLSLSSVSRSRAFFCHFLKAALARFPWAPVKYGSNLSRIDDSSASATLNGSSCVAVGHSYLRSSPRISLRNATRMARGRSCGTPKSLASKISHLQTLYPRPSSSMYRPSSPKYFPP